MGKLPLLSLAVFGLAVPHAGGQPLDYHEDIAPLLRQYCAGCHNDDDFEGDFSVERFANLKEGGSKGVMLRPGNPAESYLIKLMTGGTSEPMPPADEPQPGEAELALFREWIQQGAKGPSGDLDVSILSTLTVPRIDPAKQEPAITAMGRSSDGTRQAVARFGSVTVADVGTEKVLHTLKGLPGKVNAIDFATGDPRLLVTASGIAGLKGVATLWKDGQRIREFGEGYHRDILYDAVLSPDGKLLATGGYDARIAIWEVESGERVRTIEVHNGAIFDLAFSPDGTVLASASGDQTVKLWRVSDGVRLDTLNQPQGEQFAVVFSPDGKHVFAGGADNRVRMYRFLSREKPQINPVVHARFAHEAAIVGLTISDDGKFLATSSEDRSVKLWSLPRLEQIKAWEDQSDVVSGLAFVSEDEILAGGLDGKLRRFSLPQRATATKAKPGAEPAPVPTPVGLVGSSTDRGEKEKVVAEESAGPIAVTLPVQIEGVIDSEGDVDDFTFRAEPGEKWVFEVNAARNKSPLDSRIEILDASGKPVERMRLQAVRDSWFTFRGKNSLQSNDFRVHNWREMELNEFLYCNGEVVKLWLYPRGPDSGFTVYPGFGNRHTYFGTSGLTHALGEPCYVVEPVPAGREPIPNGLPVFTLYYENDDDPQRRLGSDSKLHFTASEAGEYRLRISDVRGFGGEDFSYQLTARAPEPGFQPSHNLDAKKGIALSPGTGKEFLVTVQRQDGFDGEIEISVEGLPEGFSASSPLTVEAGQHRAMGVIHAGPEAALPTGEEAPTFELKASAVIAGEKVTRTLPPVGPLTLQAKAPQLLVEIQPDGESGNPVEKEGEPLEFSIRPGETITAKVKAQRFGFEGRIDFGKEDSGRNLAHGLIIDNIGLNGLMIPEKQTEQRFFITAADWVPESTRTFHLKTGADGGRTTQSIVVKVLAKEPDS